jgi:hypothetical protein
LWRRIGVFRPNCDEILEDIEILSNPNLRFSDGGCIIEVTMRGNASETGGWKPALRIMSKNFPENREEN